MAQDRAQVAITPFLALCKSATSPRAASDLITQATTAQGTFTFAELLSQPNIASLKSNTQYATYHKLLEIFSWGTWETYTSTPNLPKLNDPQALKLRLLSLLSYAAERNPDLTYKTLCHRLQLAAAVDLEHLVTTAIYSDLLTATLNPATQLAQITSVAPIRDLAPGSAHSMLQELGQWSGRCDSVLVELEFEIAKVKADALKRATEQAKVDRQIQTATEANEKMSITSGRGGQSGQHGAGGAYKPPRSQRKEHSTGDVDVPHDEDLMDIDNPASGAKKKSSSGMFGRLKGR